MDQETMLTEKLLKPSYDLVFKALLGSEKNKDLLKNFLMHALKMDIKQLELIEDEPDEEEQKFLDDLQVVDPHTRIEKENDKYSIIDIKCETKSGEIIGIELQMNEDTDMRHRLISQNCRNFTSKIHSGEDYSAIQRVVAIVIAVNHVIIKEGKTYAYCFRLRDREEEIEFSDLFEIDVFDLQHLPKETEKDDELTLWLRFFKAETREEFEMLAKKNANMKRAYGDLQELSANEHLRELVWNRERNRLSRNTQLKFARDEGLKEGLEKGLERGLEKGEQKGRIEGAQQRTIEIAKDLKFFGMPVEQISKATGLSSDEIQSL